MEFGIVFLFFIIAFGIFIAYLAYRKPKVNSWSSKSDLFEKADNGDLVFFSGTTLPERAIKVYSGSPFTHVGMIFRDLDEVGREIPFIWEADIGQGQKNGPRVIKLEDKLDRWKGLKIVGWRRFLNKNRPTKEAILNVVSNYLDYDMDTEMYSWAVSNFPSLVEKAHQPNKVFCSELIAMTLHHLKIIEHTKSPVSYSPSTFVNIEEYHPIEIFEW